MNWLLQSTQLKDSSVYIFGSFLASDFSFEPAEYLMESALANYRTAMVSSRAA
jgi:hypothetical protein